MAVAVIAQEPQRDWSGTLRPVMSRGSTAKLRINATDGSGIAAISKRSCCTWVKLTAPVREAVKDVSAVCPVARSTPWRVALWGIALAVGILPFMAIAGTKGQLGLICLAFLFLAKQISPKKTFLAGVLLTLALLKPTLSVIPVAAFLLWAFMEHKYKFLAGFFINLAILFGASWMAVGNWFPDYLSLLKETGGAPILWSYVSLTSPWNYIFIVAFLSVMACGLINFIKSRLFHPWISSSIIVGMALMPMRWIYDLAAGFLTLGDIRQPRGWTAVLVGLALLLPWMVTIFPEPARWNAMLVGMPVVWALVWLMNLSFIKKVAAGEDTVDTKDH